MAVIFLGNISFARSSKKQSDDSENPYGFTLVEEISDNTVTEDVDMEEINENDTYQAQANADAAAMQKLEKEASQIKKKVKPEESNKSVKREDPSNLKTRQPANKISASIQKFLNNPKVVKFTATVRYAWGKFKRWFLKLPGIRHWFASPYSMENYKKELGKVDYVEKKNNK